MLQVEETSLKGVYLVKPSVQEDRRGNFYETYNEKEYKAAGLTADFIQDDISVSVKGVLRGLHGDPGTYKLVQCAYGSVYAVILNGDESSPDFGKWESFVLSAENRHQLYVPPMYANGFLCSRIWRSIPTSSPPTTESTSSFPLNTTIRASASGGRRRRKSLRRGMPEMELVQILQTDFDFTDERGKITQLVHEGFEQVNVLTSKKGVLRGAHFHRLRREAFYVLSGSVEFTLTTNDSEEKVLFQTGDFFLIEPGVVHSLYFPEDCVMVQLYDRPVELPDGSKDIYREELLEK